MEEVRKTRCVTEWKLFRSPDIDKMKKMMRGRVVIDGRNVFDPELMREHGFTYDSVGRPLF